MAFVIVDALKRAGLALSTPTLFLSGLFSHSTNQALAPIATSAAVAE
jgi:hypothetical protein